MNWAEAQEYLRQGFAVSYDPYFVWYTGSAEFLTGFSYTRNGRLDSTYTFTPDSRRFEGLNWVAARPVDGMHQVPGDRINRPITGGDLTIQSGQHLQHVASTTVRYDLPQALFRVHGPGDVELLRFDNDGTIYLHGNRIADDRQVVDGFREFLELQGLIPARPKPPEPVTPKVSWWKRL